MMAVFAAGLLRRVLAGDATTHLRLRKGIFNGKLISPMTTVQARASRDGAVHHLMMLDPIVTIFLHMLTGTFKSKSTPQSRLQRLDLPTTTPFLYNDGNLDILMFIYHYYYVWYQITCTLLS
jgi:hypothetical protein